MLLFFETNKLRYVLKNARTVLFLCVRSIWFLVFFKSIPNGTFGVQYLLIIE